MSSRPLMQIVEGGMGEFLNPPGHAERKWCVADGRSGCSSLTFALTLSWVPESTKEQIRKLLRDNPGTLTEDWVRQCYTYFAHCYSPDGIERSTEHLVNVGPPEHHLAHLHIRQFFPDYGVREDLIK